MGGDRGQRETVERWISGARREDHEAIDGLCRHYEPRVRAYVQARVGPRLARWVEPADIVQGVLFEVLGALGRVPAQATERDLLRRLLRTARSRIQDAARRHARDAGETAMPVAPSQIRREPASMGSVSREDEKRWIHELVAWLPEKYREVVRLCALEERSFVEAGRELGTTPDAVRMRYERARRMLGEKLEARRHG